MSRQQENALRLIRWIDQHPRVVVAFSGGVDSSVVAAAAARSKSHAVAVTADSASVARWQIDIAKQVANEIGIEHRFVQTDEGLLPQYRQNDSQRCFHCKSTLYEALSAIASDIADPADETTLLSGTNADDLGDYRPGIEAGKRAGVMTPLADLGFGKAEVRELAQRFGLSNHQLPASPCLASRIAYGTEVTPERLSRVERAEAWLRERGFTDCRVRLHEGELARIEVPKAQVKVLVEMETTLDLSAVFQGFGFRFVTVDLRGLQSGSLNRLITIGETALASSEGVS